MPVWKNEKNQSPISVALLKSMGVALYEKFFRLRVLREIALEALTHFESLNNRYPRSSYNGVQTSYGHSLDEFF